MNHDKTVCHWLSRKEARKFEINVKSSQKSARSAFELASQYKPVKSYKLFKNFLRGASEIFNYKLSIIIRSARRKDTFIK